MFKARKYVLSKRSVGDATADNFTFVEFDIPPLKTGEVLVQAEYILLDAGIRHYMARIVVGTTMLGRQVSRIIDTKNPKWPIGKYVLGSFGWATHQIFKPIEMPSKERIVRPYMLPDFHGLPITLSLGMLGLYGNTAYFGLLEICKPKPGETLVVSGASGSIGSHAGQIGKILGLTVVGIAGSDEKCKWLVDELKFDHAINYTTEHVATSIKNAAPNGIDCYFDTVGGEISSAVMSHMNECGRIAVCGSTNVYNSDPFFLPKCSLIQMSFINKQLKMEGFSVNRWHNKWMEGINQNLKWILEGKLRWRQETVVHGFDQTISVFLGLLYGGIYGKAIVKVF